MALPVFDPFFPGTFSPPIREFFYPNGWTLVSRLSLSFSPPCFFDMLFSAPFLLSQAVRMPQSSFWSSPVSQPQNPVSSYLLRALPALNPPPPLATRIQINVVLPSIPNRSPTLAHLRLIFSSRLFF